MTWIKVWLAAAGALILAVLTAVATAYRSGKANSKAEFERDDYKTANEIHKRANQTGGLTDEERNRRGW